MTKSHMTLIWEVIETMMSLNEKQLCVHDNMDKEHENSILDHEVQINDTFQIALSHANISKILENMFLEDFFLTKYIFQSD